MTSDLQPDARDRQGPVPSPTGTTHRVAFGVGAFFTMAGVLFLLERLDVVGLSAAVLWPLLLIGLGLAVVAEEAVARLAGGGRA